MAITTYAELQTAAAGWIGRSDLTDRMPEFIALAEGVANRMLDSRQMYARDTGFSITSSSASVPELFGGVRSFTLNTSPVIPLQFVKADDLGNPFEAAIEGTGAPRYYSVIGDSFVFSPAPDANYTATLVYRQMLEGLSESNTSNWLLASHPDVYLNGVLAFAYQYTEDSAQEGKFRALFEQGLSAINTADTRQAYGSAPSRRVRGFA